MIYVLCSIVLIDCVWTSCNILTLRAKANLFQCFSGFKTSLRIQSLTFWHCLRYRRFKFKNIQLKVRDQHLLKIKNCDDHNDSRISLFDLLEYRRLPSSEGLQGLQTFATINSRMFSKQTFMKALKLIYSKPSGSQSLHYGVVYRGKNTK